MTNNKTKLSILIMASVRWYNASAHYAFYLAEELKRAGQDVVIFGIPNSPIIERARQIGIDVIDDIDLMKRGPLTIIKDQLKFRKIVIERGFNIIHPHFSRDHTFAYYSLIGRRPPIIRTRSDSLPPKRNPFNRFFYKRSAMHYAVSANYMRPVMRDMGIEDSRVSVVPLSIDFVRFSKYRPERNLKGEFEIPKNRIVVSYIGRLHRIKGVEYFVKSYPLLKNKKRFHFIVSGEEIDMSFDYLYDLARQYNIENISFMDRINDVREILSITDIGVIPSIGSEAVCRVALEMFSFGIPVIGSDLNSIPETIADYEGIIVNPGMPGEIAEALDKLVSDNGYKRISKRIGSKMLKMPPERMLNEYMDIYTKLL